MDQISARKSVTTCISQILFSQDTLGSKSADNTHPAGLCAFPTARDARSSGPAIQEGHPCARAESGCCHLTLVPLKGKSIQSFQHIEAETYFALCQCFNGFAEGWEH